MHHSVDEWLDWLDDDIQRAATKGSMFKRRPVTGGVLQGLILGLTLFSIFVSDVGSGIECSNFANVTKLRGAVDTPEGRDARGPLSSLRVGPVQTS